MALLPRPSDSTLKSVRADFVVDLSKRYVVPCKYLNIQDKMVISMWLAFSKNYKKRSKIKGRLMLLSFIDLGIWIGDAKVLNDIKVSINKLKSKISKEQRVSRWYWLPWSGVLEAPWTNCLLPTLYVYYQVLVLPGGVWSEMPQCWSDACIKAHDRASGVWWVGYSLGSLGYGLGTPPVCALFYHLLQYISGTSAMVGVQIITYIVCGTFGYSLGARWICWFAACSSGHFHRNLRIWLPQQAIISAIPVILNVSLQQLSFWTNVNISSSLSFIEVK